MAMILGDDRNGVMVGFLRGVYGVTLRYNVHSCKIRKTLNVEPLQQKQRIDIQAFKLFPFQCCITMGIPTKSEQRISRTCI